MTGKRQVTALDQAVRAAREMSAALRDCGDLRFVEGAPRHPGADSPLPHAGHVASMLAGMVFGVAYPRLSGVAVTMVLGEGWTSREGVVDLVRRLFRDTQDVARAEWARREGEEVIDA
jgi:hypothetical protein